MALPSLKRGLEHGAIVHLAATDQRMMRPDGTFVTRPKIGVRLNYQQVGRLTLPSGRIVAEDPILLTRGCIAFEPRVHPGEYVIWTVLAETQTDTAAAFAVLQLSDEPAVRCEPALREGDDPAMAAEGLCGGVGVDSGMAAMTDQTATKGLGEDGLASTPGLLQRIEESMERSTVGGSVVEFSAGSFAAVWHSGFGDGSYTPFWCFGASGRPCLFAIDFGLIATDDDNRAIPSTAIGHSLQFVPLPPD